MRHHSTSIVGPDIDGPTKDGMIAAMEDASKLVASWPQWKREVLRDSPPAQPSMKEAMARVDARAEKVVANIPLSQRAIISKDESPPAQPSVGERSMADRLGEIAFRVEVPRMDYYRWENAVGAVRDSYCNMGLAVRREVLAEPFTDEDNAAAVLAYTAACPHPCKPKDMRAALSAALASRVKRAEREGKQ